LILGGLRHYGNIVVGPVLRPLLGLAIPVVLRIVSGSLRLLQLPLVFRFLLVVRELYVTFFVVQVGGIGELLVL
jgi:hypothetical protein